MTTLPVSRRTALLGLAGVSIVGIFALVGVTLFALWHLTGWSSGALDRVTDATMATVAATREDGAREIEEAKAEVVATVGAVAQTNAEAARAMEETRRAVDAAQGLIADPQAALDRAAEAGANEIARNVADAAAVAAPDISEQLAPATAVLSALSAQHPQHWPNDAALRQLHRRQAGSTSEYAYSAAPGFELSKLRQHLVAQGYTEHVLAEAPGSFEAVYRAERQLLVSASTSDAGQRIEVREMPLASPKAAP